MISLWNNFPILAIRAFSSRGKNMELKCGNISEFKFEPEYNLVSKLANSIPKDKIPLNGFPELVFCSCLRWCILWHPPGVHFQMPRDNREDCTGYPTPFGLSRHSKCALYDNSLGFRTGMRGSPRLSDLGLSCVIVFYINNAVLTEYPRIPFLLFDPFLMI